MNPPKVVAGQRELEVIYSATRNIQMGAEQHEKLAGLARSVMGILEKASVDGEKPKASEKSDGEKGGEVVGAKEGKG